MPTYEVFIIVTCQGVPSKSEQGAGEEPSRLCQYALADWAKRNGVDVDVDIEATIRVDQDDTKTKD